jgi:energy-coupling factor transporter ATP-binding protein EcfA2
MPLHVENENLFRQALDEGVNLLLGAGFPVLAQNLSGEDIPVGGKLQSEIRDRFDLPNGLDLPMMASILEAENRDAFHAYLRQRFSIGSFDERYMVLDHFAVKSILTTNIDDLAFHIYDQSTRHYLNDKLRHGSVYRDRAAVDYLPLHGCVLHDANDFVFSKTSIASAFSADPDKWARLTNGIQDYPTVFWGYSLSDSGVLQALAPRARLGRAKRDMWFLSREANLASDRYLRALGFNLITGDTAELLDYLLGIPRSQTAASTSRRTTRLMFPDECVPDLATTPARPIADFYLGAPPDWYDIFSGRVHRTAHAPRIENAILSGKNVLVIGMTASGKSTLMMQVAASLQTRHHKLVCDSLTVQKAEFILNKLAGDRAIIFVDNFADSIDAFSLLAASSAVQVVGFDRDYLFERASHLIDRQTFVTLNVTGLDAPDIQSICEKMPPEIRRSVIVFPATEEDVSPSLHEVIVSNIAVSQLATRFAGSLVQLEREDEHLHDFLIMCCYVHSCRVPVPYSLASAFLSEAVQSYADFLNYIKRLNSVVLDYGGQVVESDQDHFVPRSTLFAEAIMDQVAAVSLKRVLLRFHREISPVHICRYDTFRRYAFDAHIMKKAFGVWEEGRDFYQEMFEREGSPYIRQQGALYLAHRRRFREAFAWIDEARNLTQSKVFSIRNSYAIILFRSNIDAGEPWTEKVRLTLRESMDMLAECYRYDLRKQYHALTFADQAVKYFDVYRDGNARDYLLKAAAWLEVELKRDAQNRSILHLRRMVERRLRDSDVPSAASTPSAQKNT